MYSDMVKMEEHRNKLTREEILGIVISLAVLLLLNFYWFEPLKQKMFLMGDDIRFYNYVKSNDNMFSLVFMSNLMGSYRPVAFFAMTMLTKICGVNGVAYLSVNLIFNYIIIVSLFYVIYNLCRKNLFLSFTGSVIYLTSIYSYYGMTQLFGFMEQMCVFFAIWFFYSIFRFIETQKKKYYVYSIVIFFLILFTHERFLALFGVYIILNIFVLYDQDKLIRLKNLLLSVIPVIVFVVIKVIILRVPIFNGTGQIPIKFSIRTILDFTFQSILSMFGFNDGAEHLFGYSFKLYTGSGKILVCILCGAAIVLFGVYVYQEIIKNTETRAAEIKKMLLFIFTEGAVIICYAVSARIEMREIYVPYTLLIIYALYCIGRVKMPSSLLPVIISTGLFVISINNYTFQKNVDGLFFMRAMKLAKSSYNTIMNQGDMTDTKLYIENFNELVWAMMVSEPGDIFYMYDMQVEYELFDDLGKTEEKIKQDLKNGNKVKVMYSKNNLEVQILDYWDVNQNINLQEQMIR